MRGSLLADAGQLEFAADQRPHLFLLINGTLEVEPLCGKADTAKCGSEPPTSPIGGHAQWNLLDLAGRAVAILVNQIYRFSNDRIHVTASKSGFVAHTERIRADLETFSTPIQHPHAPADARPCRAWKAEDVRVERPLEFHPRYMHCLVAYGALRADRSGWAALDR